MMQNTAMFVYTLHTATKEGRVAKTREFLARGANPNGRDSNDCTPLHLASERGHDSVARLLIEAGADVEARNKWGQTPLHMAARKHFYKLVYLLLSAGADVNARSRHGSSPLHLACIQGKHADRREPKRIETIRVLLEAGADGDMENKDGRKALTMILALPDNHPSREELLRLFQELAPEAYFSAFCTAEF